MDRQHVQTAGFEAVEQPVVVIFICNAVASVDFIVSGQIERDLRAYADLILSGADDIGDAASFGMKREEPRQSLL